MVRWALAATLLWVAACSDGGGGAAMDGTAAPDAAAGGQQVAAGDAGVDPRGADDGAATADDGAAGAAGAGGQDDGGQLSGPDAAAAVAALFEPDRLLEVEIELDPVQWEAIRAQGRSLLDIFGGDDCLDEPFGKPFTYARAQVTVDGQRVDETGVRKKGFFGSLSYDKPSLKIDFGEYVDGRTLGGVRRMTLNNNVQDASHLNQCLGYALFADAGVPAPRCNFARVTVNGEYLGVYSHVEAIKKPFLREHFASDEGNLYEGTLSDFRPGWEDTFERKTNERSDPARDDLRAVTDALAGPGDALSALDPVIDLDRFYDFWTVESLIGHVDGYSSNTNNFLIYAAPRPDGSRGRFTFIPWGADQLFDNGEEPSGSPLPPVYTRGAVASRLYADPDGRARYVERMEALLDDLRLADRLEALERMRDLIAPHVPEAQRAGFEEGVANLRGFLQAREARVRAMLDAGLPEDPTPPRETVCMQARGTLSGSFSTTWNSLDNPDVTPVGTGFSGSITPTDTDFDNTPNPLGLSTAVSGIDPDADSPKYEAAVAIVIQQLDGSTLLAVFSMAPEGLSPRERELDFSTTRGVVVRQRDGEEGILIGILAEGTLTLEQAGTGDGDPVSGRFDATVYDPGFLGR
ncbi:MAG: CotH kinase family protein [Myxococcales bacterium]